MSANVLGVKRTSRGHSEMSAFDPKREPQFSSEAPWSQLAQSPFLVLARQKRQYTPGRDTALERTAGIQHRLPACSRGSSDKSVPKSRQPRMRLPPPGRLEIIQSDFRLAGRISTFNRAIGPDRNMNGVNDAVRFDCPSVRSRWFPKPGFDDSRHIPLPVRVPYAGRIPWVKSPPDWPVQESTIIELLIKL